MSRHGLLSEKQTLGVFLGALVAVSSLAAPHHAAAAAQAESREAFVVRLAQELSLPPAPDATPTFSDLATSDPDYGYVMAASHAGWIAGFPDGTFAPHATLTREQAAKIEVLALGLQDNAISLMGQRPSYADANSIGRWAWGYVNEATTLGILHGLPGGAFGPTAVLTTAEAEDALVRLRTYVKTQLAEPVVTGVSPVSGPAAGGSAVVISGTGFARATGVDFGTASAASFTVHGDTSITAVAPPGTGTVVVTVTTPTGTSAPSSADHFTYVDPLPATRRVAAAVPTALSATPTAPGVLAAGAEETATFTVKNQFGLPMPGVTVDFGVHGTLAAGALSEATAVTDDNGTVTVEYRDSTVGDSGTVTAEVTTPAGLGAATAQLTVVSAGVQIIGEDTESTGAGATSVTAGGTSSAPGITAEASGGAGAVTVQDFDSDPGPPPAFSAAAYFGVSLSSGMSFTGVTIKQCGVPEAGMLYWLDGGAWTPVAPSAAVDSPAGCLTFVATSGTSPSVPQLTGTLFAVGVLPVVSAVSPATGPAAGGTAVTITGTGFTDATGVDFGSTPAARFTVASDTTIVAVSPSGTAGTVDVTVTTPCGSSATGAADRFTYVPPVAVAGLALHWSSSVPAGVTVTQGSGGTWTVTVPQDEAATVSGATYAMTSATLDMTGADTSRSYPVTYLSGPGVSAGDPYGTIAYSGGTWSLTPRAPQTFETAGTWAIQATVEDTADTPSTITVDWVVPPGPSSVTTISSALSGAAVDNAAQTIAVPYGTTATALTGSLSATDGSTQAYAVYGPDAKTPVTGALQSGDLLAVTAQSGRSEGTYAITVDLAAPTLNPPGDINAANEASYTLSGTGIAGDVVSVLLTDSASPLPDMLSEQTFVAADGTWSITFNASSLTDGPITIAATQSNLSSTSSATTKTVSKT